MTHCSPQSVALIEDYLSPKIAVKESGGDPSRSTEAKVTLNCTQPDATITRRNADIARVRLIKDIFFSLIGTNDPINHAHLCAFGVGIGDERNELGKRRMKKQFCPVFCFV